MSNTADRRPVGRSSTSGTENAYDVKTPVRFNEETRLHFTRGQKTTLKRASRKAS